VAKLVASGVPEHIAAAFVLHGIPKSGRYEAVRDVVCQSKFVKFFIEKNPADFDNPHRLGAMVPHVVESKSRRFHAVYKMSDIQAAKFSREFPEFDVIARGVEFNQHAYYANKRYAECELLVSMVHADAHQSGLNPRSVVDLGGNARWHGSRNREYVLCNNPVLGVRDVMRYKTREIFASSRVAKSNSMRFEEDVVRVDYGIAVHSTYDMTPREIAGAMYRRGIKKFFGVINCALAAEADPKGVLEADGIVMTVDRDVKNGHGVRYTFSHDPSLEYSHKLRTLRSYTRLHVVYGFYDSGGNCTTYVYKLLSVRGQTVVFSIEAAKPSYNISRAMWKPSSRKVYYITIRFLGVDRLKVDAELFDRLVLQAAGARNIDTYDIVSLFRYAKSLRQRVSINGIVLSSGFTQTPEDMVSTVVAAYAVAAAYRVESVSYFKEAAAQLASQRSQGFLRDVYRIVGKTMLAAVGALPAAMYKMSGMEALDGKIKALVASGGSITVEVDRPHLGHGLKFNPGMFEPSGSSVVFSGGNVLPGTGPTPLRTGEVVGTLGHFLVRCDGMVKDFRTYGVPNLDHPEMPGVTVNPIVYKDVLEHFEFPVATEEYRGAVYDELWTRMAGLSRVPVPVVLHNGDRVYRASWTEERENPVLGRSDLSFVDNLQSYFVFRGVGSNAVSLDIPPCYRRRGKCVRFVLFYEKVSQAVKLEGDALSGPVTGMVSGSTVAASDDLVVNFSTLDVTDSGDWTDPMDSVEPPTILRMSSADDRRDLAFWQSRGEEYMTGALPVDNPTPPRSLDSDHFYDATQGLREEDLTDPPDDVTDRGGPRSDLGDTEAVSSSDVVPGKSSMEELVELCDRSRDVALSSARRVVDMALAVANGDAPAVRWHSMVQGEPGEVRLVRAIAGEFVDFFNGEPLPHMAVSDGDLVYDTLCNVAPDGVYVTSEEMRVYTGGAIRDRVASKLSDSFSSEVTGVNAVAGAGKTYSIVQESGPDDVVLCETRRALEEAIEGLVRKPEWKGHNYTVDAFLLHNPKVEVCHTLWVDEAYRLHAGKVFAVVKMLRPARVLCFGDDKQVAVLPFVPGFDFVHHQFPFDRLVRKTETYRCPADVCFLLSTAEYYGFRVTTHNPVLRSVEGPVQYKSGMFSNKPASVPLLTYTRNAAKDLREEGVKNVMTIGEAQGSNFEEVILFREKDLKKALYYSAEQTLVGMSRHKRRLTLVSAAAAGSGDSLAERACAYIRAKADELVLASHLCPGVVPVAGPEEYYARQATLRSASPPVAARQGTSVMSYEDWDEA